MSTLSIFNPANGQLVNTLPADDAASVAAKATGARAAQSAWAATPLATRKSYIEKFRAIMRAERYMSSRLQLDFA